MIYWFTGQPGHGKTLHAIERLLEFKDQGRIVYACNIRKFDYQKTGVLEMTPEQFRNWMTFLPDGAVALVDEAYEHGMLPKRAPGAKVPEHVEQLAKHRHRGLDFIFVSQSPDKQCDQFVHDLIERHVHVRRLFGSKRVQLREFDKFEARAEKATPIVTRIRKLPTRPMGTYESTELDTTERRIPWYVIALPIMIVLAVVVSLYVFGSMGSRIAGGDGAELPAANATSAARDGASATGRAALEVQKESPADYAMRFIPRVPSEPWSAPAYDDKISLPSEAPRLFCMSSMDGVNGQGKYAEPSCTCLTEQGTAYYLDQSTCRFIARRGQYEPYRDERNDRFVDGPTQLERGREQVAGRSASSGVLVERGGRVQGTFPESPSYTTSTVTPPTGIDL